MIGATNRISLENERIWSLIIVNRVTKLEVLAHFCSTIIGTTNDTTQVCGFAQKLSQFLYKATVSNEPLNVPLTASDFVHVGGWSKQPGVEQTRALDRARFIDNRGQCPGSEPTNNGLCEFEVLGCTGVDVHKGVWKRAGWQPKIQLVVRQTFVQIVEHKFGSTCFLLAQIVQQTNHESSVVGKPVNEIMQREIICRKRSRSISSLTRISFGLIRVMLAIRSDRVVSRTLNSLKPTSTQQRPIFWLVGSTLNGSDGNCTESK
ncbi:hypothetical protein OGAPHI_002537 [Ogataea philodendri]|uniref:Uncharacterized protein n=1 Tax=Ogataea philodendri TaxID=1378263 RepID=A0A9P8PBF9_9ASCO|nr:uncharacterized protein OGAPHI_002537 [Ogataea philodendri]KAH3668782.1 hypothetical protein OGAPHI_002537 [Ogataea philodendri]